MVTKEELKWENDAWSFDKIKTLDLASFFKWKKMKKNIFIAVKKSLLDQVTANYC